MNKKILVAAIAVATAAVGTSAVASTKLGGATQKGSLLIFPRVEAITGGGLPAVPSSDTYISITNDSSTPVNLQCYWGTTDNDPSALLPGGNAAPGAGKARSAIRNNHYMDFSFTVTKNQPVSFWAGDLSGLANSVNPIPAADLVNHLTSTVNAPQFNFFQDGSQSNAGELKCWAVDKTGTKEIHHNHLLGKAAVYTFAPTLAAGAGQAHEYNAWSFQANYWGDSKKSYATNSISYTGKVLPTPGVISLDGKEYDQCPSALVGQFIPAAINPGVPTRTTLSVSNCHEDMRQDASSHITKLTYTVWNANEVKYTGAHECMGAWYESDLGLVFPHFTYKTLKTDTAYFRAQPTASKLCNQDKPAGNGQKGALDSDVEVSSVVGVQVNDIGGFFQTSSSLVGLGSGTTYDNEAVGKGEILWDPNSSADRGKN